nr:hypothetical protein [Natranaerobius trueperi]
MVTAAANRTPSELLKQLKEGGRMVIPIGNELIQELQVITKQEDKYARKSLGSCRFVPLK